MTRENADVKGRRLLVEARLVVNRVGAGEIEATCRGDSGEMYTVGHVTGGWYCSCPALGHCSHLVALQLVTLRPQREAS